MLFPLHHQSDQLGQAEGHKVAGFSALNSESLRAKAKLHLQAPMSQQCLQRGLPCLQRPCAARQPFSACAALPLPQAWRCRMRCASLMQGGCKEGRNILGSAIQYSGKAVAALWRACPAAIASTGSVPAGGGQAPPLKMAARPTLASLPTKGTRRNWRLQWKTSLKSRLSVRVVRGAV